MKNYSYKSYSGNGVNSNILIKQESEGMKCQRKNQPEFHLHIRTFTKIPAACFQQRADSHNSPYGIWQTTAVNWYLSRLAKDTQALLIRISIYSQNLSIFWKSVQNAFSFAGLNFLENYDCPEDEASAGFLTEILCYQLEKCENCYIFIDDFHLLKDDRAATFLCRMAGRIPENVHLIVASRNHFISDDWIVRLGGRLHRIEIDDLRLNAGELSAYIRRCGTSLTASQLKQLLKSSEGWFAAVYLNLCSFSKSGELPGKTSDIYQMFSASMLNPLPEDRKEFLSAMGLADEFTEEMAEFITKREDVHQILKTLTRQNAFVTCLNDGQTYRFHHMMKECAFRAFRTLDDSRQAFYYERYGAWYEKYGAYIHACQHTGEIRILQLFSGWCKKMPESYLLL